MMARLLGGRERGRLNEPVGGREMEYVPTGRPDRSGRIVGCCDGAGAALAHTCRAEHVQAVT